MQLEFFPKAIDKNDVQNNKLKPEDRAFHNWYRFVLSFPAHLVREYISKFDLKKDAVILDPFCGTGTTLVEAKKQSIKSIGIEAHPMAHFAAKVKTNWDLDTEQIMKSAEQVYQKCESEAGKYGDNLKTLSSEQELLLLKNSINPIPLHKCLVLLEEVNKVNNPDIRNLELLALAFVAVYSASNLKFGPEVGVRRIKKENASVFRDWLNKIHSMVYDLEKYGRNKSANSICFLGDSRDLTQILEPNSIDAIVTSPPYPNEKDYTRTTRLESVLLKFIQSKEDLKNLKQKLIRSNTRNVYVNDEDDLLVKPDSKIGKIAGEIERRRIALNKTSGFEKLYHRVTKLYFGGMKKHLSDLRFALKRGARLAYVVGDQASYLQVHIETGELLAEIAHQLGYEIVGLDLFRNRLSTTTGKQLREEVLLLKWNGERRMAKTNNSDNAKKKSRYDQIIEKAFFNNYKENATEVYFNRDELVTIADELGIELPKNLGDIIYSYRYRNKLPDKITNLLEADEEWIIRSVGRGKYQFAKTKLHLISPNPRLSKIKILDATPEIIRRYALNDEQALLAILRYNRLIDIYTGVTCYPLQSHLRTTVKDIGQVETDEIYIGVSKKGEQFVFPVQAKAAKEQLGIVQIEQDIAICKEKFPGLICRPIAAQFIEKDLIAIFEFEYSEGEISIKDEKHYRLVINEDLTDEEIQKYNKEID